MQPVVLGVRKWVVTQSRSLMLKFFVGLKPVDEWTSANNREELQELIEEKMSVIPGMMFNFSQPIAK